MSQQREILINDKEAILFKEAMILELKVIFTLYNLLPQHIADIIGVSRTQVDKYLIGSNNLSIFLLKKLLNHFNLTLSMFFDKVEKRVSNSKV